MIEIGKSKIGLEYPVYFIADIAANHDGDLNRAKLLIKLAANSGANAVKFQHFEAETIVSDKGFRELESNDSHQSAWADSVFETYKKAELPFSWIEELHNYANELAIDFFTAPYSLDLIEKVEPFVSAFKVGSGDITWIESLEKMSRYKKPILIATGASDMSDVIRAVECVSRFNEKIVLMQCNTNYTASPENIKYLNLNVLTTYSEMFKNTVLGLSDHTDGHLSVLGAVALGARAIEKHFTDDRTRTGPDHKFSLNPYMWAQMVHEVRKLESSLGDGVKRVEKNEINSKVVQQRSLYFTKDLNEGHVLIATDVVALRPLIKNGLKPYELDQIIGKPITNSVRFHDPVLLKNFS